MNNIKILYSMVGLLSFTDIANSAVYQCKICPNGTYGDGTKTSCAKCPSGAICPEGSSAPLYLSQYSSKLFSKCGELGVDIARKSYNGDTSTFIINMINDQKVKINASGNILKKGESGYNTAYAYTELNCYDIDGYYTSDAYKRTMDSLYVSCGRGIELIDYTAKNSDRSGSGKLSPGVYSVSLSGAGGGGGGSYGSYSNAKKWYERGGTGCDGESKYGFFYILKTVDYSIFASTGNGNHGGDRADGKDGGSSSFKMPELAINIIAAGGGKGGGASKKDSGKDCVCSSSNCSGAKGGSGGRKDSYPKSHPGGDGEDGYVKIYRKESFFNCDDAR